MVQPKVHGPARQYSYAVCAGPVERPLCPNKKGIESFRALTLAVLGPMKERKPE